MGAGFEVLETSAQIALVKYLYAMRCSFTKAEYKRYGRWVKAGRPLFDNRGFIYQPPEYWKMHEIDEAENLLETWGHYLAKAREEVLGVAPQLLG